jgi:hypothetical protein
MLQVFDELDFVIPDFDEPDFVIPAKAGIQCISILLYLRWSKIQPPWPISPNVR